MSEDTQNTEATVKQDVQDHAELQEQVDTKNAQVSEQPVDETPRAEEQPKSAEVDLSSHFAEIKRREREIRAEKAKIKAQVEEEKNRLYEELKANPMEALKRAGVSTETLTSNLLDLPEAPTPDEVRAKELEELKAWKNAQEQAKKEAEQQKLVDDYKTEVFSVLESDPDKYELLSQSEEGKKLYWDSIIYAYKQYGEAPKAAEIADRVEALLFERGKKLLASKKFAPTEPAKPKAEEASAEKSEEESSPKKSAKTISNTLVGISSPTVKVVEDSKPMSAVSPHMKYQEDRHKELLKMYDKYTKK